MKIVFNMESVSDMECVTGVGQHQLNIVQGIYDLNLTEHYIFLVNEKLEKQLKNRYPDIITYCYGKQEQFIKLSKLYYNLLNNFYLNHVIIPRIIRRIKPDLIFHPFNCVSIKTDFKLPVVTMVLDMYHRFFRQCLSLLNYRMTVIRHNSIFRNSDSIITSTQSSKNDILQFYPAYKNDRIHVIPVPVTVNTEDTTPYAIDKPYILCVNSLRYHKNIHTLIKAFNLIKDKTECDLVLLGEYNQDEEKNIRNQSDRIRFTGYLSHQERNFLYKNAEMMVSPTMYEGFGMTPVEAMLFNKKVLVSDIAVMRESTFDKAFYFDDIQNEESLAEMLITVLNTKVTDEHLENVKKEAEMRYQPERIAKMIHSVFIEILSEKNNENCH
ncbi:MAG: glycosyltransferase family 4 protein [Clostridia bacterium]|nr:glycosyltransferase family 4 protein [Clostridia bacterium]